MSCGWWQVCCDLYGGAVGGENGNGFDGEKFLKGKGKDGKTDSLFTILHYISGS